MQIVGNIANTDPKSGLKTSEFLVVAGFLLVTVLDGANVLVIGESSMDRMGLIVMVYIGGRSLVKMPWFGEQMKKIIEKLNKPSGGGA